ncbi:acyltransferase domain-containing protein [Paenibacillus paridis]|uniref:acyltransferase domain-containing protein n=1 Tax=Paenibacillus paridis TaxID=2583376 RepID=UPI0011243FD1|nr:acyltransferase domain-containing protein [Paenibacillus paridis]
MNIKRFCEGIMLEPAAAQQLYAYRMEEETYEAYKQHFYADYGSFFESVKQTTSYRKLLLYLFVRFGVDAYEEYQIRGISDEIYFDTFSDIHIWCKVCRHDFGEYGIEEYNWLQEHVQLRLFRLGRLQFQPIAFDRDLVVNGRKIAKNQIVFNIHIPSGEPLTTQGVEKSFELARAFFRGISPVYICHSWLLYPKLGEVLSAGSNILQFQKYFHIYEIDIESREAEQRIFNKVNDNPSEYEEQTRLQRSAKAYLEAGHRLGSGYGIVL